MIRSIRAVVDLVKGKTPSLARRSARWPEARRQHLAMFPKCSVCGGTKKLEVHHIQPFHVKPELELDPNNLITLCESRRGGLTCHLYVGHLGNYKNVNPSVVSDSELMVKTFYVRAQ